MNESLEKIERMTTKRKRWKRFERMYVFTQVLVELAFASAVPFVASKAIISLGKYTISENLRDPSNPYSMHPHAALLHDVQHRLNLTFGEQSS